MCTHRMSIEKVRLGVYGVEFFIFLLYFFFFERVADKIKTARRTSRLARYCCHCCCLGKGIR